MKPKELTPINIYDIFGLLFDEKNKTVCTTCAKNGQAPIENRSCCCLCGFNAGYFTAKEHIYLLDAFRFYNYKKPSHIRNFHNEIYGGGFFDPINKCCPLPRYRRSHKCLTFYCDDIILTPNEKTLHEFASLVVALNRGMGPQQEASLVEKIHEDLSVKANKILTNMGFRLSNC